jgi:hypothetical protein
MGDRAMLEGTEVSLIILSREGTQLSFLISSHTTTPASWSTDFAS